eukprot:6091485-Prymnesium_polylepis.1
MYTSKRSHVYISHCESGRYQSRQLKSQLEELLPGVKCHTQADALGDESKNQHRTDDSSYRSGRRTQ